MRRRTARLAVIAAVLGATAAGCRSETAQPSTKAPVAESSSGVATTAALPPASSAPAAASARPMGLPQADTVAAPAPTVGLEGEAQPTSAHGSVTVTVAVVGAASEADTRKLAAMHGVFDACANQALAHGPPETGQMVMAIAVAPHGKVRSASVVRNHGFSADAVACMTKRVRAEQFDPAPHARTVKIGLVQTIERP